MSIPARPSQPESADGTGGNDAWHNRNATVPLPRCPSQQLRMSYSRAQGLPFQAQRKADHLGSIPP